LVFFKKEVYLRVFYNLPIKLLSFALKAYDQLCPSIEMKCGIVSSIGLRNLMPLGPHITVGFASNSPNVFNIHY
jgi:hypothetical protein